METLLPTCLRVFVKIRENIGSNFTNGQKLHLGTVVNPGPRDPVLWRQYTNTHGLQKSCGEKGAAWPLLSERVRGLERAQERAHPCLDRLFLLFWAHYIRMVLIYYAQVHHR